MERPSNSSSALEGLLGLADLSSRKSHYRELLQQVEALEHERNRYKWLFENAHYGIFQSYLYGGFRSVNPAFVRMLGFSNDAELLSLIREQVDALFVKGTVEVEKIRASLLNQQSLLNYETQLYCKDGKVLDVLMNILQNADQPGVIEVFVADISARKRHEYYLNQLNSELEQRVVERTQALSVINHSLQQQIAQREVVEKALREARDLAQEANRSKDKYLAAASHDLLQPLNAARLLIATLQERKLPSTEKKLLNRAHLALESTENLLADLLDIARLDQAKITPSIEPFQLSQLFSTLYSEFEPVAKEKKLKLIFRDTKLCVETDIYLVTRILRNLLSNACRYTDKGKILVGARRSKNKVRIEVWDTGVGIAKEYLDKIFLEFNQVKNKNKGVGLGLAIVERISNILNTDIIVNSIENKGSCFSIEIPLIEKIKVLPKQEFTTTRFDILPNELILVIDNEPEILISMQELLVQWECRVLVARDFESALLALGEQIPAVILADLHLDNDSGLAVISQLRYYYQANIPAILITADHTDQEKGRRQQLNVPVLNKPIKPAKLRAALSQILACN